MEKTYIAIDLKSFYASVECVERGLDPMTTNLLVADAAKTEKTICLAVSPTLKSYGISGRARLFEAVEQVRKANAERRKAIGGELSGSSYDDRIIKADPTVAVDYIAAPPRMALYRQYSTEIVKIYFQHVAPEDLYAYSIDEVFIDATAYLKRGKMTAQEFARMLILDVWEKTGITATAGIGPNMYLCKVALDITAKHIPADEYGVRIAQLDEMTYRRQLWEHDDLTDFWMIGVGISERLHALGLHTMGDVARCSLENEDILYNEFGKNAQYIIDQAWGWESVTIADIKAYKPASTSVSSGQVLQRPYTAQETRIIVREMVDALVLGLVEKGLMTDQIVLHIGYDIENITDANRRSRYRGPIDTDRYGRQVPRHAHGTVNLEQYTSSTKRITEKTLELYDRIINKNLLVRRLYLNANRLLTEQEAAQEVRQLTLFGQEGEEQLKRERKMQKAVLGIKNKFGPNAILKGTNLQKEATARERNQTIGGHKA